MCFSVEEGLFFIVPCTDQFVKVDLRTVSFDVPPQEVSVGFTKRNYPLGTEHLRGKLKRKLPEVSRDQHVLGIQGPREGFSDV